MIKSRKKLLQTGLYSKHCCFRNQEIASGTTETYFRVTQTCGLFEVVGLATSAPVVCKLNELYYVSGANGSLSNGAGNKRKFPGIPSSISLCLFVPYLIL